MAYEKEVWSKIIDVEVNSVQQGTDVSATKLNKIEDTLEIHVPSLVEQKTRIRVFKPKIYTMMLDVGKNWKYENYYTDTSYTTGLDNIKPYGFDGFIANVEIQPSKAQRDAFLAGTLQESELIYRSWIPIDKLKWAVNEAKKRGLKLIGIETHCVWAKQNWNRLTPSVFFQKYDTVIQDLMTNFSCEFITVFNESGDTILSNSNNYSYVETLLQKIRANGFKTGLAGFTSVPSTLIDYIDIFSVHSYPPITNKGVNASIDDSIIAWEESGLKEILKNLHYQYPNKEIWITESGVQNFYEALAKPEVYLSTGTKSDNNMVQRIYQEGLFEYLKTETYIKCISLFYLDAENYYLLLQELYDFYLRNEVIY